MKFSLRRQRRSSQVETAQPRADSAESMPHLPKQSDAGYGEKITIADIYSPITLRLKAISEGYEECPICADKFEINCTVSLLPCNHYFCRDCAAEWFSRNYSCPVCRYALGKPNEDEKEEETVSECATEQCDAMKQTPSHFEQRFGRNFDLIMFQALRVRQNKGL